ncbi:hypothetical protein BSPLISOX_2260 [uncultured Gammaproteobacteria bacterium]|jgi:lipopolysaccharide export system protein LptA|nr:hypothetical protein [uncultured Gammaproteobacteria bacterium]VVH66282.1 hypothetical protein BSPLISOX_2260 [uncultured Gammaproteobacteria bacterium]
MNKLIFLFLSLLSFALHALMGDHKAFVDVKAQTVVIDEPRGLSTYTGNAEVTKGSLVLSAEEILIFSVKQTVSKIIAKGSKKKLAHYKQSQPNQARSVEANAQTITYFINQQLVRLEGNAHLVQGFDSFSGGILNYDIKKDKMVAGKSKNDTQRVKFKIKL